MRSVLEVDRRPFPAAPPSRRRMSRRTRWLAGLALGALLSAALGYLIADQVAARGQYGRAHASLAVARQQTHTVSGELDQVRRDLGILTRQVGSDSNALSQDSSQLLGAQTSLAEAQTHVTQQATLISSLQTCLPGVEQALNALAVGNQAKAIAALNSVAASCTAAEDSSG